MAHSNNTSLADFMLFEDDSAYSFPQYSRHTGPNPGDVLYGNQSDAPETVNFSAMLRDDSAMDGLHTQSRSEQNKSIHSSFCTFSDSSEESTTYQSQSYILPTTSAEYHYSVAYGMPRTLGPYDSQLTATPGFILHPPTMPLGLQLSSHNEKPDYRSTPSASPATSVCEFDGPGSEATHNSLNSTVPSNASATSSVRGSPYSSHEDLWSGTLPEKVESLGINAGWTDGNGFVDPRILASPQESPLDDPISTANSPFNPPTSPSVASNPTSPTLPRKRTPVPSTSGRLSPFSNNRTFPYPPPRRDSNASARSSKSPRLEYTEESKMRTPSSPTTLTGAGRDSVCPECGKSFRDLRAHQLTHQQERPEKCPIATCEYSKKGFARKYDCQRHTLTHYKGTMVCGFCPGSGSPAEKSFNRADVFKRHLMSVHHVEQQPPNGRKKTTTTTSSTSTHNQNHRSSNSPSTADEQFTFGLTAKCSTCEVTFATAQQFYEHLDDCVLSKVVQEEPAAAFNEINLDSVTMEDMAESLGTLQKGRRSKQTEAEEQVEDDDEDEMGDMEEDGEDKSDEKDETWTLGKPLAKNTSKASGLGRTPSTRSRTAAAAAKVKRGPASSRYNKGCITKSRSKRGGKKRKNFPAGWGCQPEQMITKRRCLMVFDGPNILCRDEMMMNTEWEVRANVGDNAVVSDLDFWTMQRASAAIDAAPGNVEVH